MRGKNSFPIKSGEWGDLVVGKKKGVTRSVEKTLVKEMGNQGWKEEVIKDMTCEMILPYSDILIFDILKW